METNNVAGVLDGKSVLVVDDDPDIVEAIRTVLAGEGATVTTAGDGNAAIEMATSEDPDVVVLDAMLPKRSGFLVLESLKAKKGKGTRPYVVMITGNQGRRHQVWAESLGVDEYLNKPFRMERLVRSVERLVGVAEG